MWHGTGFRARRNKQYVSVACGSVGVRRRRRGHPVLPAPVPRHARSRVSSYRPRSSSSTGSRARWPGRLGAQREAGLSAARRLSCQPTARGCCRPCWPARLAGDPDPLIWSSLGLFAAAADPLRWTEWWYQAVVGADRWSAPQDAVDRDRLRAQHLLARVQPAKPKTLNKQILTDDESELRTRPSPTVAAAPKNGVGLISICPRARLRSFDVSPQGLRRSPTSCRPSPRSAPGPGASSNISFGGATYFPIEEHAILTAIASGDLVVAAAGNFREILEPDQYPRTSHTCAGDGPPNAAKAVTVFSSATPTLDCATPGHRCPWPRGGSIRRATSPLAERASSPPRWSPGGFGDLDGRSST